MILKFKCVISFKNVRLKVPENITLTRNAPSITFIMSIAYSYEEASSAYSHGTYRPEQQTKSISTYLKHSYKSYAFDIKVTI